MCPVHTMATGYIVVCVDRDLNHSLSSLNTVSLLWQSIPNIRNVVHARPAMLMGMTCVIVT